MTIWYTADVMMNRRMRLVSKLFVRPDGLRVSNSSVGGSVARASEARASMMRFTHSNWMARRGDSPFVAAPSIAINRATTLTVSWNCKNLPIDSNTLRPHFTACTMDLKLSSFSTISHAFCAILVPTIPMAKPTSAAARAGASFVPSPVTATTSGYLRTSSLLRYSGVFFFRKSLLSFRPFTRMSLSRGEHRDKTRRSGHKSSNTVSVSEPSFSLSLLVVKSNTIWRNNLPSMHTMVRSLPGSVLYMTVVSPLSSGSRMSSARKPWMRLHSFAMADAV
mmetsp:Transcript_8369/g.12167  ORF Transcript_8369/g.12167 Transcript_8369/m.12167 type:complete len:278 (-) Transcript_8369:2556-3389(-)